MMKLKAGVISWSRCVLQDMTSIASVIFTAHQSTLLARAKSLADTTPMAHAIITRATVLTGIIQLMVNAIKGHSSLLRQRVKISEDITISHRQHTSVVLATTTVSIVLGLLLMDAIAI